MNAFKIGIIGNGFVGKATKLLKSDYVNVLVYDIKAELCEPLGTTLKDLEECELIFICLPTPINFDGSCYTKILENVISKIKNSFKIIRSTVPINFCNSNKCFFMPEFLTEANWKEDFINASSWIVGVSNDAELNISFIRKIKKLFKLSYFSGNIKACDIKIINNNEAEFLKLAKNCFLATKVGIMNELYQLATAHNLNYNIIKTLMGNDKRIGNSHLNVPGSDGKYGYGGTCFPKDMYNLYNHYQEKGIPSHYFQTSLLRNETYDRPERDWLADYGRTALTTDKAISLVAGGAGFIGSHLCRKLLELGHIVICLDNLSTGNKNNIQDLLNNENFLFKYGDINNRQYFPRIDYLWHLACPASPPKYQKDGLATLETGLFGTFYLLELALQHNAKFLYTSTSEIYGDPLISPQKETYWGNVNPIGDRSCYDEHKRCAETIIYETRKKFPHIASNFKIVRIFNTYGPYMDLNDGRVITNFIKSIKENKPITIYGDGTQTRSFCYIDDMIRGLLLMMSSKETGPINLGNPSEELSMNQLRDLFDPKYPVNYYPLPNDDPKKRRPDITLAINKLNWEPKISLKNGIKKTMEYFNKI